jgi:Uncharacterized protein conserved in archaea
MISNKQICLKLGKMLELSNSIVGFRFIHTEDEFEKSSFQPLKGYLPYCVMVRCAGKGHPIKALHHNFGCSGASKALGLIPCDEPFFSGEEYMSFHIFKHIDAAKKTSNKISICQNKAIGVEVGPLSSFEGPVDVVIIVTNPYNAMRIVQGYNYHFGTYSSYKMGGLQAICGETTAYPYVSEEINVSLLCAGTRFIAAWDKNELSIGIPFSKFESVVDGVYNTINPLERDTDKKRIEKNFQNEREPIEIEYGKNYDTDCYLFGATGRK